MRIFFKALALILILSLLVGTLASCDGLLPSFVDGGGTQDAGQNDGVNDGTGSGGSDDNGGDNGDGNGTGSAGGGGSDEPIGNVSGEHGDIGTVPALSGNDPYENISESEFYADYTPATSYEDAYYRTENGFVSGTLTLASGAPLLAEDRPTYNGAYIRNTRELYSDGGEAYTIVDGRGAEVMTIYKCGAYVALEEVAAYVYAFGTYPPNYTESKSTKPTASIFGKYLRVNHSQFSGDTTRYPNEPDLPNASGGGGNLQYYEMDIGGASYNNGTRITRGAYRIVYAKRDVNGNGKYEYGELHVFYTYNHYEDFQEYLNYYGGWGDRFGFETGGSVAGKPSQYVDVYWGVVGSSTLVAIVVDFRKELA